MEGLWPIAIVTFMLTYNLAEASFLRQNSLTWVIFVATAFGLGKQLKLHKRSSPVAPYVRAQAPVAGRNSSRRSSMGAGAW
jgi:O-antigen ligase